MTKKEMFNMIATVNADNEEIVKFCEHEIELLENRKSGKRGLTKTQKANEAIKVIIAEDLAVIGRPMTVSELIAEGDGLGEYTNQKISALLRQMVEGGIVVKTVEKKKAYFTVA